MFKKLKHEIKEFIIDELFDQQEYVEQELNRIRCKQGNTNKDIYDKLKELQDGELEDLKIMSDITKWSNEVDERLDKLEQDLLFFRGRYESSREQSRENLMLLMEYLGVYLDYEDDKKVIKKDKKK